MRQLTIQVGRGAGDEVLAAAVRHEGRNLLRYEAEGAGADGHRRPVDVVVAQVSNGRVEGLMDELQQIDGLRVTLLPTGVIALYPPKDEAADQVTDVAPRSPLEVFLNGLMSVGSWKGLLAYAVAGGAVVWSGLYTGTSFLLVAAMLIAPFAGPAMTLALATARGDLGLMWRSVARYAGALLASILTAFAISWALGQEGPTPMMIEQSMVASVAVLLPLVAGAAGALNLVKSEHDSLVSGAATGVLVAASLAPPAGIIGMAAALARWDLLVGSVFQLCLQLVGINVAGAIVFRLYGLTPEGPRYSRGRAWAAWAAWLASAAVLAGLLVWQFSDSPNLQRSTIEQRAVTAVIEAMKDSDVARLVKAEASFTRTDIPGQNSVIINVAAQYDGGDERATKQAIARLIREKLKDEGFNVTPLVDVTLFDPPEP